MKLCNHSRQSFDKVIPDLFSVNFIPSYGLWKFCLNCINLTSVPWAMDFSDITSSIIFIFSWSRLPMGWERQITFWFKHCPQALIAWQNFLHRKSCSIQKCLDTWDVFCVVFSIQIFRSKVKYFLVKYVKSFFTYLITFILIRAQSIFLCIIYFKSYLKRYPISIFSWAWVIPWKSTSSPGPFIAFLALNM